MTNFKNIAVAAASLLLFSGVATAQTATKSYQVAYAEPLTVKYLGTEGDYLLFQVNTQSNNPSSSSFTVTDKAEGDLYSTNFKNPFNTQTIKIEKLKEQVLDFKLVISGKTYQKSFTVNTNQVEKTIVAEGDITML